MIKWNLETRQLKDLKAHPKNPRQLSKDQMKQLEQSIETYGLIDKPIINTDNTIIGGHQRVNILKSKKITEVECWVPERELNQHEIDECNIRLNKNTGEWDFDVLANEWDIPDLVNWGFKLDDLDISDIEEVKEEKAQKGKKLTMCPQCGHEF